MEIISAGRSHVEQATSCLANAFVDAPQMLYLFPGEAPRRRALIHDFFALLMEARLAMGMPVLLASDGHGVQGAVMGYDAGNREWPQEFAMRFAQFESSVDGLPQRFALTDEVMAACRPAKPHYYLGVVGVDPAAQGQGIGKALIEAFTQRSNADAASDGTFLETANWQNVTFYQRLGFVILAEGKLDDATKLWCLYRPNSRHTD